MTIGMSLSAVVARIDQLMADQQQLSGASPATAGAATTPASAGTTSAAGVETSDFAQTLAQAQQSSSMTSATATSGQPAGVVVPEASWNPQQKPIASWIAPVLDWASQHGWSGNVTSGYRSYSEQASINAQGLYSAPAGTSNHESAAYPGGAVDVSDPSQLLAVLRGYPGPEKLVGGVLGPVDPEHFSATGH
jgi:hypothetical protein